VSLWVIGGLDPTGGAGVLRDRWTATMLVPGIEVVTVVTAQTEQGDGRPARATAVDLAQLAALLRGIGGARAIKLGLVPAVCVPLLCSVLADVAVPCVLDPVLHASDGGALGSTGASLRELARTVELVTPNRDEACALLGRDDASLEALGLALAPAAVLLKDADDDASSVCDRLLVEGRVTAFERPRRSAQDPRGTGCALATAIACARWRGDALAIACARAIAWLDRARLHARTGPDGRPHLPREGFALE